MDLKDLWQGISPEDLGGELPSAPETLERVQEATRPTTVRIQKLVRQFRKDLRAYLVLFLAGVGYASLGIWAVPPSFLSLALSLACAVLLALPLLDLWPQLNRLQAQLPQEDHAQPLAQLLEAYVEGLDRIQSLRQRFLRRWLPFVGIVFGLRFAWFVAGLGDTLEKIRWTIAGNMDGMELSEILRFTRQIFYDLAGIGVIVVALLGGYMILRYNMPKLAFQIRLWRSELDWQLGVLRQEQAGAAPSRTRWQQLSMGLEQTAKMSDFLVLVFLFITLSSLGAHLFYTDLSSFPFRLALLITGALLYFFGFTFPQLRLTRQIKSLAHFDSVPPAQTIPTKVRSLLKLRKLIMGWPSILFLVLIMGGNFVLNALERPFPHEFADYPNYFGALILPLLVIVVLLIRRSEERKATWKIEKDLEELMP